MTNCDFSWTLNAKVYMFLYEQVISMACTSQESPSELLLYFQKSIFARLIISLFLKCYIEVMRVQIYLAVPLFLGCTLFT